MPLKPASAFDAGAIVLRRSPRSVYWAERAGDAAFLGGYHAFVGGRVEPGDAALASVGELAEGADRVAAVAGIRELFEETGVLVARFAAEPSARALAAERAALRAAERGFAEALARLGATLDLGLLRPAGRWLTPAFSPRRFDTHFFLAELPAEQEPQLASEELARGEWTTPDAALERYDRAEVLVPPPVLHILRALAGPEERLAERLLAHPAARGEPVSRIEFLPGIVLVPLRTETLPPASHTNAYVIGRERAVLLDPGTDDARELEKLAEVITELAAEGVKLVAIVLTHHHPDHVAGTATTRERFQVPVHAHPETRRALAGRVPVDADLLEGERIELGAGYALRALHTPGHARGHLAFFEERTRALISGDNVVGLGSVLIDPQEGDMGLYLESLARLKELSSRAIFGGHGPALAHPQARIGALIAHRQAREAAILRALEAGPRTLEALVVEAYVDTPQAARSLAERQALAHLVKLEREQRVRRAGDSYRLA